VNILPFGTAMGRLRLTLTRRIAARLPGSAMARMIRRTALEEWPLLVATLLSGVFLAVSEGATFVVIFQAARLLSASPAPIVEQPWPGPLSVTSHWLNALPRGQLFVTLLAGAVALQVLASLGRYLNGVSVGYFAARCQLRIAPAIHRYVLGLSYPCASAYNVGDLVHRATLSPLAVQVQLEQVGVLLCNLLLVAVYLAVLIGLTPWLSLVAIGLAIAIGLVQRTLRPRIRLASRQLAEVRREIAGGITEDIQILRLLHSTASIDLAHQRLEERVGRLERRMRRLTRLIQVLEPVSDLLPVIAAATIGLLSWQIFDGKGILLIPNLVTFVLVLQRLNLRLARMAQSFNLLNENSGPMELLEQLLDPTDKQFRRHGGLPFAGLQKAIRFEGVGLAYPERDTPALEVIDLEIPKGNTIALVGESGAGKSSLVDLLVGLQNPSHGRITVDGVDLRSLDLDSWQRKLGIVSQDVLLLNGTIRENISFGLPAANLASIAASARAAGADDFIEALPEGYDTMIGERGFRLSGGQRQRLSLARALLRDPPLLILDEATSALDSPTEARVLQALDEFANGRTVITIAHRLSSVMHADLIVVMSHGRIVERGRHDELLARGGMYANLVRQQGLRTAR
jgi:ATP-binding cassette subfamily B protein/subfamily B ATP-binding cassette protein MsbA